MGRDRDVGAFGHVWNHGIRGPEPLHDRSAPASRGASAPSRPRRPWPSTPRRRRCRRRASTSSASAPASRTSRRPRRSSRPPQAACADPTNHHYTPDRRAPGAAGGHRREDRAATRATRSSPPRCSSPTAASRRSSNAVRDAVRPRRRGPRPRPLLDHLPRVDRPGWRGPGGRALPTSRPASGSRWRTSRRPPPTGPRCCCSCRRPTRPAPSTRGTRSRPSGGGPSSAGLWVVTDEIYEHLVYGDGRAPLDAGGRARARRHLRGGERRGQDLRDDRLAGRLDDRPARRRWRPPPTCSRTRPRTSPTSPRRPRCARSPATSRPWPRCEVAFDRRRRTIVADAERDRRACTASSPRAPSTPSRR